MRQCPKSIYDVYFPTTHVSFSGIARRQGFMSRKRCLSRGCYHALEEMDKHLSLSTHERQSASACQHVLVNKPTPEHTNQWGGNLSPTYMIGYIYMLCLGCIGNNTTL